MASLPDYDIKPHKVALVEALGGAFLAVAFIAVSLRVWTRTKIVKCWGWDDWTILLTLILYSVQYGVLVLVMDSASKPVSLSTLNQFAARICTDQALYLAGTILLKISLAFFFLRFLIERWARCVVWVSVVIYSTVATGAMLLIVFECGIPNNYSFKEATGQCVSWRSIKLISFSYGALNAITDWVFPLLASHFLCQTKMSYMEKASCCAILVLAVVGSIASIIRTFTIPGFGPNGNTYSSSVGPLMWGVIEGGLGITAASMATLRPLFRKFISRTKAVLPTQTRGTPSMSKAMRAWIRRCLVSIGSSRRHAKPVQQSEVERCDTMDLESGGVIEAKPWHVGIFSSVVTETERNTSSKGTDESTKVRETRSTL